MTLNERIRTALLPFGDTVVPGIYTGEAASYYTFNYDLLPVQFADNVPTCWRALIQIHYVCPLGVNSVARRRETLLALHEAGFGWPEVIDATEGDAQHYVFECESLEGNLPKI